MTAPGRFVLLAAFLAAWWTVLPAAHAADSLGKLRRERARLTEMKQRAEKAAAELADTIRREKTARGRVDALGKRLARQRQLIARIDRKLASLGGQLDRTDREVRALEEKRARARRGLSSAAAEVFTGERRLPVAFWKTAEGERRRRFARGVLVAELVRYGRLTEDKQEKEKVLSRIERRLEDSERRMAEQKKVREKLATQKDSERRRLAQIEKKKKAADRKLRALRARIAGMEALVSRIERQVRERQRGRKGPSRFSGVPGGLVPPLAGKVVGHFGRRRDPVFDVEVENRGVEIEAASGAVIHAVGRGETVFVGGVSGFGKVLILQHGSGLFSVYGRAESFTVKQGEPVSAGDAVGKLPVNPDGKSVLYFELRAAGTAIDPLSVIPFTR